MGNVVLETVQWSSLPDVDNVEPIGDRDYMVLSELGDVLKRHGLTRRFGICLLHRHFDVADDEIATEVTDIGARISTVKVVKRDDTQQGERLETMWRFQQAGSAEMVTRCVKDCHKDNGHKRVHIKVGG